MTAERENKFNNGDEEFEKLLDEPDMVNHPPHYTQHPSGVECIDIVKHYDFPIGNAIKYLWRAGLKGDATKHVEDLKKAIFYINIEIDKQESSM